LIAVMKPIELRLYGFFNILLTQITNVYSYLCIGNNAIIKNTKL